MNFVQEQLKTEKTFNKSIFENMHLKSDGPQNKEESRSARF